jgi:hypothetical protein
MKNEEKFNKKLLVEGNDDKHVILALCEKFDIPEVFDVSECNGFENLLIELPVRLKQSDIETIGIIVDADSDIKLRWEQLKDLLYKHGLNVHEDLTKAGLIIKDDSKITIGVWIMPNNNLNGMLEDFMTFLVPNDDKLMPIVKENLYQIENKNLNKYKPIHHSKAVIHSWLANQENPGTPLGQSITKKYLSTDEETCLSLVNWINRLFCH